MSYIPGYLDINVHIVNGELKTLDSSKKFEIEKLIVTTKQQTIIIKREEK